MSSTCRPPLLLPWAPPRPCDLPTEDKKSRRDLVGNNQSTRCLSVKSHACGVELGSALKCVRKSATVPATRNVPKDSASITPLKMLWSSIGEVRHALSSLNLSACKNNWYDLFHVVKDRVVADNKMANSTIIIQPVCKFGAVNARAYTINDLCRRFNASEFARHETMSSVSVHWWMSLQVRVPLGMHPTSGSKFRIQFVQTLDVLTQRFQVVHVWLHVWPA